MKKYIFALCIAALLLTMLPSAPPVHAARTRTVWYVTEFDGTADALADGVRTYACALGNHESSFVRAMMRSEADEKSKPQELPATIPTFVQVYNTELKDYQNSPVTYAMAHSWVGEQQIVCSQYY